MRSRRIIRAVSDADRLPAPARDALLFELAPGQMFVTILGVGALGSAVGSVLFMAAAVATGRYPAEWLLAILRANVVIDPLVLAAVWTWLASRRPAWVRVSGAGLELASSRTNPIFLPWRAVAAATLHRRGTLAVLEVMPTDPQAVVTAELGGRRPWVRQRGGRQTYVVEAGLLQPGPPALRAELARWLAERPQRGGRGYRFVGVRAERPAGVPGARGSASVGLPVAGRPPPGRVAAGERVSGRSAVVDHPARDGGRRTGHGPRETGARPSVDGR